MFFGKIDPIDPHTNGVEHILAQNMLPLVAPPIKTLRDIHKILFDSKKERKGLPRICFQNSKTQSQNK